MKRTVKVLMMVWSVVAATVVQAQNKIDDERMTRDIEVAENVLSTLIRQQMNKRNFFPMEVKGTYSPGFGVTFRLPMDWGGPMMFNLDGPSKIAWGVGTGNGTYTYSYSNSSDGDGDGEVSIHKENNVDVDNNINNKNKSKDKNKDKDCEDCDKQQPVKAKARLDRTSRSNNDSLVTELNQRIINASRDFIADYGDLIGQLAPTERIKITNRNESQRFWYTGANMPKRKFISLECSKGDILQFKQGKITRDQLMGKITVVDAETSDELSPDLELLSSMFNRLFRSDLSKSYYTQENLYYERLKDYGVVYYMQVVSSVVNDYRKYSMPTIDLEDITKEIRDKKVKELYPVFENDVKESMLDYGRTLKSLKDNELLVFNIKMTQCEACGIPSSLELSVKYSVLKDFSSGKLTKEQALAAISVKKGPNQ